MYRFVLAALGCVAACSAVPADAAIIYGFAGDGIIVQTSSSSSKVNVSQTVKSGTISIDPAPGASTYSFSSVDFFGYTTTSVSGSVVGDVLSLAYDRTYVRGPDLEIIRYNVNASFLPGTLQGAFPDYIDFATVAGGSVSYSYSIRAGISFNETFSGSLINLSAIPEPASWMMMILGFAAIGAAVRRRPRVQFILA